MKMVITLHTYQLVLPCLLGVEGLVAEELRDMGAENVAPENGRVLCAGSPEMIARANIRSRFAERVLVLLGTFEAKSFESLFRGVKALPWTEWIGRDDAFPVKGALPQQPAHERAGLSGHYQKSRGGKPEGDV